MIEGMTSAHFIFIPSVLLLGIVIGWILGSRAARDAYAAELKTTGRALRAKGRGKREHGKELTANRLVGSDRPTARRCARTGR